MAKYIVELESGTHIFVLGPEGIVHIGEPDVVYETIDGMQIGDAVINAKPYTEPDLEQVRKEGYEDGYKTAKVQCNIQAEKDLREVGERHYKKGLSDAWEAARKICTNWVLSDSVLSEIFGMDKTIDDVMKENTASEAIEKIRQYEQEKEEQIQVGDEVAFHHDDGRPDTVVVVTYIGQDGFIDGMDGRGTQYAHKNPKKWTKTGRHFPEIATILEKMRGEQDG